MYIDLSKQEPREQCKKATPGYQHNVRKVKTRCARQWTQSEQQQTRGERQNAREAKKETETQDETDTRGKSGKKEARI